MGCESSYGKFHHDMPLAPEEVRALIAWVEGGAHPGDAAEALLKPRFPHRVEASATLQEALSLVGMRPHAPARQVVRVPSYHPARPLLLPRSTRIECTAWYDNPPNKPRNPSLGVEVRWGAQSWEEMMIGWFDVAVTNSR